MHREAELQHLTGTDSCAVSLRIRVRRPHLHRFFSAFLRGLTCCSGVTECAFICIYSINIISMLILGMCVAGPYFLTDFD